MYGGVIFIQNQDSTRIFRGGGGAFHQKFYFHLNNGGFGLKIFKLLSEFRLGILVNTQGSLHDMEEWTRE